MVKRGNAESGGPPDDASNILLLGPSTESPVEDACIDLLGGPTPGQTNVLAIVYGISPAEFVDRWSARMDAPPERGGIVAVGDTEGSVEDSEWTIHTVANPTDLSSVGIELSDLLSTLNTPDGARTAVCFDNLTALLDHAGLQQAFRFLHIVTGRVETAGAVGHYHIDPDDHDRETMATFEGLFNTVLAVEEDGYRSIER